MVQNIQSAFHLLAQKSGNGLGKLCLYFAELLVSAGAEEQDAAHYIAFGKDGGSYCDVIGVVPVHGGQHGI